MKEIEVDGELFVSRPSASACSGCCFKKESTANEVEEFDIVSKPKHYMLVPGIEVRDICKALAERMQDKYPAFFISDYIQFLQYVLRFDQKNGIEDLKKAQWYLEKLINEEVKE